VGFVAFRGVAPQVVSLVTAIAAGAILAMLIDTMIPEAFEESHALAGVQSFAAGAILTMLADTMLPEGVEHAGRLVGLVTALGFICAFLLSHA
jgi:ZIP family zinc transporter